MHCPFVYEDIVLVPIDPCACLWQAYERVMQNKGAARVDGLTV